MYSHAVQSGSTLLTIYQGCGSALPHPKSQRRAIGPINTFAQAQEFCKSEAVCGIAGREEKSDFECIDTTVALDSCGGCVTPHRFTDVLAPAASGIECGRLPGVVTAACSNSRCIITQCREGWHLNARGTECVNVAGGRGHSSRMRRKGRRHGIPATVIDSNLAAKINAYVGLVIDLTHTSGSIPTPHTPGSHPPVSHADLVGGIVAAAVNLLNSRTVVELVTNVNAVVNVNHIVQQTFDGCRCVDKLGLGQLAAQLILVVESALDIQHWCGSHLVGVSAPYPHPSTPAGPTTPHSPIPNTADAPITVGLDDALNALGLASKNSRIDIFGLGGDLTSTINNLLNSLALGPANVHQRSLVNPLDVTSTVILASDLLTQLDLLVDLVVVLGNNTPTTLPAAPNSPPIIGIPPTVPSTVDYGLIDCIVQAVVNLVSSPTVASLVGNVNVLVNVNAAVADLLGNCGCIDDMGLRGLLANLEAVINVALGIQDWCIHHPVGVPAPHPTDSHLPHSTGTSVPVSHSSFPHPSVSHPATPLPSGIPAPPAPPNELNDAIIVGLDQLLTGLLGALGLGPVKATVIVDGIVGSGLAHSLNNVLNGLGIGPANVIPRGGDPLTGPTIVNAQVDAELVAQIRGLVNLVLVVKNGSSTLPTAPHGPPVVPGPGATLPVDTNLVDAIVRATINLINSDTVSSLLLNLDVLAQVNALVNGSLAGCGCVGNLGLEGLVRDIEVLLAAVLNVQNWCAHHPVIPPQPGHGPAPTTSLSSPRPSATTLVSSQPGHGPPTASLPSPHPSATPVVPGHAPGTGTGGPVLHIPIKLDLGDLLASLGLHSNGDVDAILELNNLLNTAVSIVINLQGHSSHVPPALPSRAPHPTSVGPPSSSSASHPAHPHPSGTPSTPPPVHQGLINGVLQATLNLLHSVTGADFLANVNILLGASGSLAETLDGCGCVDHLGLHAMST
ncbi:hypothetical protein DXG03_005525 [Asterophora parasitica]|uniref:Protein CPL1-like domain-containing protein n=1 Tax=Asterophora parasitica TaxID=117018 RepID=A0A9P7GET1_9AGAR|nr:hypothetical protein DXG03_005525 [Asterophora parasitica]